MSEHYNGADNTCMAFESLGYPEINSWRIILRQSNHLSQIRYSSACSTFCCWELGSEVGGSDESPRNMVCTSVCQRCQLKSNKCEDICKEIFSNVLYNKIAHFSTVGKKRETIIHAQLGHKYKGMLQQPVATCILNVQHATAMISKMILKHIDFQEIKLFSPLLT